MVVDTLEFGGCGSLGEVIASTSRTTRPVWTCRSSRELGFGEFGARDFQQIELIIASAPLSLQGLRDWLAPSLPRLERFKRLWMAFCYCDAHQAHTVTTAPLLVPWPCFQAFGGGCPAVYLP